MNTPTESAQRTATRDLSAQNFREEQETRWCASGPGQRLASVLLTSVIRRLPSDRLRLSPLLSSPHVQPPRITSLPLVHRRAVIAHPRAFFAERREQENRRRRAVAVLLGQGREGPPTG